MSKRKNTRPSARSPDFLLPHLLVTLAASLMAVVLIAMSFLPQRNLGHESTFALLDQRIQVLRKATNAIQRDSFCIPLSAYGRALNHALDPNARVFMSGVIGRTNGGNLGYYYFLQNYLFPRDVQISLDSNGVFMGRGFAGVSCDSPAELKSNGFDLMIRPGAKGLQLIPLTQKGVPHE